MFFPQKIDFGDFFVDDNIIENIFTSIEKIVPIEQNGMLNLVFLDNDSIQNLNKKYRNKDTTTDVLSFHYYENFQNFTKSDIIGEIIFSKEKIIEQGAEYGLGSEKEFYKLLIHSVIHILGFDHEEDKDYEIMKNYEETVWKKVFGA